MHFQDLWDAYPTEHDPCQKTDGTPYHDHQCAIRMGVCLANAGYNLTSCPAMRCWHGHGRRHIIKSQELANWLVTRTKDLGATLTRRRNVTHNDYTKVKGIVFFQHFWGDNHQGNHIDLWDGKVTRTGASSDFSESEAVWFWELR
jgi:hypothetical protein